MRLYRFSTAARPCLLLLASAAIATAQEPAPTPQPPDELRALRESVEQQNKQIQALTQQIAELNRNVSSRKMVAPSPTPTPAPPPEAASTPPAPPSPPSLTPATPAPTPAAPPTAATKVPAPATPSAVATPAPAAAAGGVKHTVAKGETLTSIAKRYNISLSELENANKITDERKLQIGHVLNIPSTPNKAPEPQTDNKENP